MSELLSVLDGLAAEDLTSLTDRQKLDRTAFLSTALNRLQAEFARSVRSADVTQSAKDDGMATMQSWLRGHCRLSPREAFRVLQRGRALDQLPAVAAGFADGAITAEQVTVAARVARPEHVTAAADQEIDLTHIDAALAEVAMTRPHSDLGVVVEHYLACLDPDGPNRTRRRSAPSGSPGTPTAAAASAANSTRPAGRSSKQRWNRSCRPAGPRVMTGPGPGSSATRSCSSPTSRWPAAACRSCAAANRTCS